MEPQSDHPLRRDYLPPVRWDFYDSIEMITVRLPSRVAERLREESYRHCTSLNSLCTSKLVSEIVDCPIAPSATRHAEYSLFWQRREAELFVEGTGCGMQGAGGEAESQEQRAESKRETTAGGSPRLLTADG